MPVDRADGGAEMSARCGLYIPRRAARPAVLIKDGRVAKAKTHLGLTTLKVTAAAMASGEGHSLQRHSPVDRQARPFTGPMQRVPRSLPAGSAQATKGGVSYQEN